MMFNHGGGFITPKNFQFPSHFTPKALIAQSTTTNESCSLMLDSDVRSVTYVLKSSKESTLRQETNSTQGDIKNIRMIEFEEFEKSNSSSVQSSQDQFHRHHYIVDINTGGHGKLIAEGTLSHADSEERNVITPQNQQFLQFDFKQKQQSFLPFSQQLGDSQNFTEEQRNNLQFNDYWIQQVKLDHELQAEQISQNIISNEKIVHNQEEYGSIQDQQNHLANEIENSNLGEHQEQINQCEEESSGSSERMRRSNNFKDLTNVSTSNGGQKSKILVQDQICQESIIYEEEDSENSKSTDRQYYQLNRSISNQLSAHICNLQNNQQSSARNESLSKNRSFNQLHNTSKNNIQTQTVQAFTIEEEDNNNNNNNNSNQQQQQLQQQFIINTDHPMPEKQQELSKSDFSQENGVNEQQKQNNQFFQSCIQLQQKQNLIQPTSKEQKSSFFANSKAHLCINNIDTNFKDENFINKPYQSFSQNNEIQYEFFGASKKDSQKDLLTINDQPANQENSNQMVSQQIDKMAVNQYIFQEKTISTSQMEEKINQQKDLESDKLFYPNSSKCHQTQLDEGINGQQDYEMQRINVDDPTQRLNFDQCESSISSKSARDEAENDSMMLKQDFQNLISNYKQRNSSFPQLNSHNTSRNSNYNTNSNVQIEATTISNNNKNTSANNQTKLSQVLTKQEHQESILEDSHQKRFRNGQYSAILKKLEETLDMNSDSDFYLIKKLQLSHGVSQQHSEHDNSHTLLQHNQYKKINPATNQTYILEETGEDFIFNSKEIERLEQVDNSFLINNKENMGGQNNSSLNLDSKVLLADTIYSSCNTSHLYFINIQSSDKRGLKSQKKEGKSNQMQHPEVFHPSYLPQTNQQGIKIQKGSQFDWQKQQQQQTHSSCNPHLTQNNQSNKPHQIQNNQLSQSHQNGSKLKSQQPIPNSNHQFPENICDSEINYIKEIEYLKKEVIKLNKDLKNIDVQNCKYQEIIDQQQANILRLEERLLHYKEEMKLKQQQLETKDIQVNKLFEEKEELKAKKNKLKEQIKVKDSQIFLHQQRTNQVTNAEAFHKLQYELEQKNEILNEKSGKFNDIQKKYSEQNLLLKKKIQEIQQLSQENQLLHEEIEYYRNNQESHSSYEGVPSTDYSNKQNNNNFTNINNTKNIQGQSGNPNANSHKNIPIHEKVQYTSASVTSSSSSSSTSQPPQQGKQKQSNEQKLQHYQNLNDQRLRSYSQNDSSNNSHQNVYTRAPVFNQHHMTTSQPYNLTEESQYLVQSTQIDIQSSQENLNKYIQSQQRSQSSASHSQSNNSGQLINKPTDSNAPTQEKLIYQQLRYSYDNYKNYQQNNQQKPTKTNVPQPMTLNSAIAQYKIQALEERKQQSDLNNSNINSNILVSHSFNPSDSFQQQLHNKQVESMVQSNSNRFNGNESINQIGNKSQISTQCNSRHQDSHASSSQMGSNNTSQKSLIYQNPSKQQQQQYLHSQVTHQIQNNTCQNTLIGETTQVQQPNQSNLRTRTNENVNCSNRNPCHNDQSRNRSMTNYTLDNQKYQQDQKNLNSQQYRENFSNDREYEQPKIQNISSDQQYLQKIQESRNKLMRLQQPTLTNFNQNSIKLNNQIGERVSTSPNRKKKNEKNKIDDVSEYNSVPSYPNNYSQNENTNYLDSQNRLNGGNSRKIASNQIDLAAINSKINSNYQLIENLSMNRSKQESSQNQLQGITPLQNNYLNNNQNIVNNQQKVKREHSYSLHQPSNNTHTQNHSIGYQNQLIHSYNMSNSFNDQNSKTTMFKKPPRSSNEMRQSFQGNSQQVGGSSQCNQQNLNENLNLSNQENKWQQKQSLHNYNVTLNSNSLDCRSTNFDQQQYSNNHSKTISTQQQSSQQSSQRFDKFQKWNNQII